MTKEEIKNRTEKILFKEFLKITYDKIKNCKELEIKHPGLGELLINKSKSTLIIKEVLDEYQQEIDNQMDAYLEHLKTYKIRSLISSWIEEKMEAERVYIKKKDKLFINLF